METTNEKFQIALEEMGKRIEANQSPLPKMEFNQEDIQTLYSLGYSLYQSGNYGQAEVVFRRLILARPLEVKHWIGLASTLQCEKQYNEALTTWSMACLLDDRDPSLHFHAAECLLSLKRHEEAVVAMNLAQERLTGDAKSEKIAKQLKTLKEIWG